MWASLRSRNYRWYFVGQASSIFGTWMQVIALAWLVLQRTGSGTAVGIVTGVQFVPVLLLSGLGGVVVDRFDNRNVVLAAQVLLAVQASVLAVIVILHLASLPVLCTLAFVQGIGNAFDPPSRQAFLSELVPPDVLANALSLNAAIFQIGRIAGPAVAGLIIKTINIETCFVINALSYLVMIGAVLAMDRSTMSPRPRAAQTKGQFRLGLEYLWRTPSLRALTLMSLLLGTFASQGNVITPLLAKKVFHGDAGTLGLLSSAQGVGALIAALLLASMGEPTNRRILVASSGFAVCLVASALAPSLATAVVALTALGGLNLASNVSLITGNQLASAPEMRGRMTSFYFMASQGSNVVGAPLVGVICQAWSPRAGLAIGAAVAALGAAVWLRHAGARLATPLRLGAV